MLKYTFRIYLIILLIAAAISANAQQPLLKFKPIPSRVDSFDFILSYPPLKIISSRISLGMEMRLNKNYTLKISPSYMNVEESNFVAVQNLAISDFSSVKRFKEHMILAMVKRYKAQKKSRVYFGPYLAFGMEARRTFIRMETQIPDFENAIFNFSTKRKSVVFAIGTTKLFSKRIIFDFYAAVKYQYKVTNQGNFTINGPGYNKGFGGSFGFTVGIPIGKRKF